MLLAINNLTKQGPLESPKLFSSSHNKTCVPVSYM